MTMITHPVGSLYSSICLALGMDLGPIPVWRIAGIVQGECVEVQLCRPRATEDGMEFLPLEW